MMMTASYCDCCGSRDGGRGEDVGNELKSAWEERRSRKDMHGLGAYLSWKGRVEKYSPVAAVARLQYRLQVALEQQKSLLSRLAAPTAAAPAPAAAAGGVRKPGGGEGEGGAAAATGAGQAAAGRGEGEEDAAERAAGEGGVGAAAEAAWAEAAAGGKSEETSTENSKGGGDAERTELQIAAAAAAQRGAAEEAAAERPAWKETLFRLQQHVIPETCVLLASASHRSGNWAAYEVAHDAWWQHRRLLRLQQQRQEQQQHPEEREEEGGQQVEKTSSQPAAQQLPGPRGETLREDRRQQGGWLLQQQLLDRDVRCCYVSPVVFGENRQQRHHHDADEEQEEDEEESWQGEQQQQEQQQHRKKTKKVEAPAQSRQPDPLQIEQLDVSFLARCRRDYLPTRERLLQALEEGKTIQLSSTRRHATRELLQFLATHGDYKAALEVLRSSRSEFLDFPFDLEYASVGAFLGLLYSACEREESWVATEQRRWSAACAASLISSIPSGLSARGLGGGGGRRGRPAGSRLEEAVAGASPLAIGGGGGGAGATVGVAGESAGRGRRPATGQRLQRGSELSPAREDGSGGTAAGAAPRLRRRERFSSLYASLGALYAASSTLKGLACMRSGEYLKAAQAFLEVDPAAYSGAYEALLSAAAAATTPAPCVAAGHAAAVGGEGGVGAAAGAAVGGPASAGEEPGGAHWSAAAALGLHPFPSSSSSSREERVRRGGGGGGEGGGRGAEGSGSESITKTLTWLTRDNSVFGVCTPEDLALYTIVCCFASMQREQLLPHLQETSPLRRLLHAHPRASQAALLFANCEWGRSAALLLELQDELERDLLVGRNTAADVLQMVRRNLLLQSLQVFERVTLKTIHTFFRTQAPHVLREDLMDLISMGALPFRYDVAAGILTRQWSDPLVHLTEDAEEAAEDLVHACQRLTLSASTAAAFPTAAAEARRFALSSSAESAAATAMRAGRASAAAPRQQQ